MKQTLTTILMLLCATMAMAQFTNHQSIPVAGQQMQAKANNGQGKQILSGTARAPRITSPQAVSIKDTVTVDEQNMMFMWTPAVPENVNGNVSFTYDIRIVELMPGQQPDKGMTQNPVVFRLKSLLTTSCIIPTKVATNEIKNDRVYAIQVCAVPSAPGVKVEFDGYSPYLMFRKK